MFLHTRVLFSFLFFINSSKVEQRWRRLLRKSRTAFKQLFWWMWLLRSDHNNLCAFYCDHVSLSNIDYNAGYIILLYSYLTSLFFWLKDNAFDVYFNLLVKGVTCNLDDYGFCAYLWSLGFVEFNGVVGVINCSLDWCKDAFFRTDLLFFVHCVL